MYSIRSMKVATLCEYLAIMICIFCSGSVMFQSNNKFFLIASIILMGIIFVVLRKPIKKSTFQYFFGFSILYLVAVVFHLVTYHISFIGELGKVLQFLLAVIVCSLVRSDHFFKKYNWIIYILAFASIIFYVIPFVFPEFPKLFPIIHDYAGSSFHNAGLFCYPVHLGKFYRNQSIFWESGAFQAFLNLAIFIELYLLKEPNKKHLLIYVVALLLTKSTTGYIIFSLMILVSLPRLKRSNSKIVKFLLAGSFLLVIIFALLFYSVVIQKFLPNSLSYASFVRRFNDTIIDLKILFSNMTHSLFGISEENYIYTFTKILNTTGIGQYYQAVSSNSITAFAAQYGLVSCIPLIILYGKGILSLKNKVKIVVFFLLITFCLATENFLMTPIFLAIMLQLVQKKFTQEEGEVHGQS